MSGAKTAKRGARAKYNAVFYLQARSGTYGTGTTAPRMKTLRGANLFCVGNILTDYRVMVRFRSAAIRSARGGCVLKSPENSCRGLRGATMNREAVLGGTSIGMRWL